MIFIGTFFGALMCLSAGERAVENKKRQLLSGKWDIVAAEINRTQVYFKPKKLLATKYIVFQKQKIYRPIADRGDWWKLAIEFDADYKIREPNKIDITFLEGREKGKTRRGIYVLVGDVLVICLGEPNSDRPTAFFTKPDSKQILIALIRGDG
jgi:uncharacterized protein (TIGR03067 family)